MCHYISGLIQNDFNLEDLNDIGTSYSITFADCKNDFVRNQLDNKEKYLIKDSKYCDCGTELGSLNRYDKKRIEKSELDKLKRKGWSETKIQRWIDDKKKVVEREQIKNNSFRSGIHSDIENWITFINDLFSQTKINKFGIILHWYSGNVNSEKIKLQDKIKIKLDDLDDQKLLLMKEDMFYYIER